MLSSRLSRPRSKRSCAPCAACAILPPPRPRLGAVKVGLRLTWPSTYSQKPVPPSTSTTSSNAFTPSSPWRSTATASSLRFPKRSPARTASGVRPATPSPSSRGRDDSARRFPVHRRPVARGLSAAAHLPPRRAPVARLAGLVWPPLSLARHLAHRRRPAQLERRVLSARAL